MTNYYTKINPNFMKSKICNYFCFPFMNKDIFEFNKDNFYNCPNFLINKDIEIDKNDLINSFDPIIEKIVILANLPTDLFIFSTFLIAFSSFSLKMLFI